MDDIEKINKYGYVITSNIMTFIAYYDKKNLDFFDFGNGILCVYDKNFMGKKLKKSEPSINGIKRYVKTEEIRKKREAILTDLGI